MSYMKNITAREPGKVWDLSRKQWERNCLWFESTARRHLILRLNLLGASTRWKRVGVVKGMKFDSSGRSKGSGFHKLKGL